MCGIAGFLVPGGFQPEEGEKSVRSMRDRLLHRGPDDSGLWLDSRAGIALGHQRLSILDVTASGHQPMVSQTGRYRIVFNGEVYNHMELRRTLGDGEAFQWRGGSDTESLLAAIEAWGIERALRASIGMFAFALWDAEECTLILARDRMGEKPLYYGWQGGVLLFGSELKALRAHSAFSNNIEQDALSLYFRHGYIPAPWCIWRGIKKLVPGTYITFGNTVISSVQEPVSYWSFLDVVMRGQEAPFEGSEAEAVDALELYIGEAVAGQMIADVPLGAFLSGGIDSSTVVALMQARSKQAIRTFSIGFGEPKYNEAEYASAVAKHLGTQHTELYVSHDEARSVIPQLPEMYDEPFGDSSAIPTHLVSRLTRRYVTVALSGDGGDELFGGYGRYFNLKAERIWKAVRNLPGPLRWVVRDLLPKLPLSQSRVGCKILRRLELMSDLTSCCNYQDFYRRTVSQWPLPPIRSPHKAKSYGLGAEAFGRIGEPFQQMMADDSTTYLPDDILVKVDRAAMAVSLETRVPLLDHRVVEFAWRLPLHLKVRSHQRKWVLRQVLYRHVPARLIERPKMGFGVPIEHWIRGPLREWAEHLLSERLLAEQGWLDVRPVRRRWLEHLTGRQNWRDSLWLVLMWQAWLERNASE